MVGVGQWSKPQARRLDDHDAAFFATGPTN